jgi:hypothetical protein
MVAATDGVARKSATDVDELVQAEPRKGFVWMHSGRRGAVKHAARLQKTLTYYQTILAAA